MSASRGALFALALAVSLAPAARADEPPVPIATLSGVVFNVADPPRELAFYRDVFGMVPAVTLDHGTSREYIMRFAGTGPTPTLVLQHDSRRDPRTAQTRGNAFNRLVLKVADLDAVIARLDRLGMLHAAPESTANGYRVLHAADPEGFGLEVIQPGQPASTGR